MNPGIPLPGLKRVWRSDTARALALALAVLIVYLRTLSPTVSFIDSGELSAVAYTLGIAHPTGYPLFTLLGWVFSRLPIAAEPIVRLNMMAALFSAAGVFVFFHLLAFVLRQRGQSNRRAGAAPGEGSWAVHAASAAGALLLAFSETFWSQAVSVEVYSLHGFFLSLVTYAFLRATMGARRPAQDTPGETRPTDAWWYVFAFTLGLSFTNHMTTILLAPGFLYFYFATQGAGAASWKRIARLSVPFLLGMSLYLYLPIRASQSPLLNWGNPVSLERFLWHFSGKQYRVWIFSSTEAAGRQFTYFLETLPGESGYVAVVLALIGLVAAWRADYRLALMTVLLFVGCVLYSINYDIHDIDSYFLLSYLCVAFWAAWGVFAGVTWFRRRGAAASALVAGSLLLGCVPLAVHYENSDESGNYLVEDYTANMFASLRPNALILSYQWDYWLSASYYYQHVKGARPDVIVIDKELLRRSWYLKELAQRSPSLIRESQEEVDAFLRELEKFEHDRPYNPAVIQARFVQMITSFIKRALPSRPVYVTGEIEGEFTPGLTRNPEGLAFRLLPDTLFYSTSEPAFAYRPFKGDGRLESTLKNLYSESFLARGVYYYTRTRDIERARSAFRKGLEFNAESKETRMWLSRLGG